MTGNGILQIALYFLVLLALTKPLGAYMAKVFAGERTFLHPVLRPLEAGLYKLCGIDENGEQHWTIYAGAMLAFSLVGILFSYLLLRVQQWLPLNPQGLANVGTDLAFNTANSFGTNTNWQSYNPETTMSYFSQMIGAGHSQLLVGGVGNLRRHRVRRAGSRATRRRRWAASGWISSAARSTSCCR